MQRYKTIQLICVFSFLFLIYGCEATMNSASHVKPKMEFNEIIMDTYINHYVYKCLSMDVGITNFLIGSLIKKNESIEILVHNKAGGFHRFSSEWTIQDGPLPDLYILQNDIIIKPDSSKIKCGTYAFVNNSIMLNNRRVLLFGGKTVPGNGLNAYSVALKENTSLVTKSKLCQGNNYWTSACFSNDSGFVLAGSVYQMPFFNSYTIFKKYSSSGDSVWAITFNENRDVSIQSLVCDNQGGYIAVGNIRPQKKIIFIKLNSMGTIVWKKIYGKGMKNEANYICRTKNNTFLIAGQYDGKGMLWCINENGEIVWRHVESSEFTENPPEQKGKIDRFKSIIELTSNNIYAVGYGYSRKKVGYIWISEFNQNGKKIAEKNFGTKEVAEASCILPYGEHTMLVGGYTYSSEKQKCLGWLLQINESLDTIATKYIEHPSNVLIYTVLPLPEQKKILIGGEFWDTDEGYEIISDKGFVLK